MLSRGALRVLTFVTITAAGASSYAATAESVPPTPPKSNAAAPQTEVAPVAEARISASDIERTDLGRMMRRPSNVSVVQLPNRAGTSMSTKGMFREVLVARVGADGKAGITCVSTAKQAEAALNAPLANDQATTASKEQQ